MNKITKKAIIEEAFKKYTKSQIEEATFCEVKVFLKEGNAFGNQLGLSFSLTSRGKKSKADKIRTRIRGLLLNRKVTESNKRLIGNTGSENIESIKISLKFK